MEPMNLESFGKLLQMALLPVVMISAASLLLLSITNRLGRTVDRSRLVGNVGAEANEARRAQLHILLRRCEILRASVFFVSGSIFVSCLMIMSIFLMAFVRWNVQGLALIFFLGSLLSLIAGLIFFMVDVRVALRALRIDVAAALTPR